jgi:hypothetical protein
VQPRTELVSSPHRKKLFTSHKNSRIILSAQEKYCSLHETVAVSSLHRKKTGLFTQKQQQYPLCTGKIRFYSHKNSSSFLFVQEKYGSLHTKTAQCLLYTGKIMFSSHKNSSSILSAQEKYCFLHRKQQQSSLYRKNTVLFTQKQHQKPLCTGKCLLFSHKNSSIILSAQEKCYLRTKTAGPVASQAHRNRTGIFTKITSTVNSTSKQTMVYYKHSEVL